MKINEELQDEIDTLQAMYDENELMLETKNDLMSINYFSSSILNDNTMNLSFVFNPNDMVSTINISLKNVSKSKEDLSVDSIQLIQSMICAKFEAEKESMPIYQCTRERTVYNISMMTSNRMSYCLNHPNQRRKWWQIRNSRMIKSVIQSISHSFVSIICCTANSTKRKIKCYQNSKISKIAVWNFSDYFFTANLVLFVFVLRLMLFRHLQRNAMRLERRQSFQR